MADIIDLDDWSFRNAKNAGTRPNGYWAEQWIWTGLGCRECFTNAITKSAGAKDMQSEIFCLRGRTDMKRMTSNEYNPCFNCNFYSSCSHIRENFPVCPERARYDRLAAYEDTGLEPEEIIELKSRMEGLEK